MAKPTKPDDLDSTASRRIHISNPWHAISVHTGPKACPAVRALSGQRFLSKEAPLLPLKDCAIPGDCKCVYRHHDDRRAGPRRKDERGEMTRPRDDAERRVKRGRRSTDD